MNLGKRHVIDQIVECTVCSEAWRAAYDDNKALALAHRQTTGHAVLVQTEHEYEGATE